VIDPAALRMLERYRWPGNVRELRNVLERALLLLDGDVVQPQHLVLQFTGADAPAGARADDLDLTLEQLERKHIERVLAAEEGRVDRAAQRLDVPRSSLYQKLKRYGIPR
jgi:DNA-binding NtrC family response regulator